MKIRIANEQLRQAALNAVKAAEIGHTVEIRPTTRSHAQNRLLWLWNGLIQAFMREHYGQNASAEEWHDVLCSRLMPADCKELVLPSGEAVQVGRWRSSKAGVREMGEYLNLLDAYCSSELSLVLPHPDDVYHEAMGR